MPTHTRHAVRRDLIQYLETRDVATGTLLGHVVDLTIEGARLMGSERLADGTELSLEIIAPCRRAILVRAVCRWCQPDVNPDYFATGLEFVDPDEATRLLIGTIVSRNGFRG